MILSLATSILIVSVIAAGLAAMLTIAEAFLRNYGPCKIIINDEKEFTIDGGGTLLSSLITEKIFIPSACGGRGTCGLCKLKILSHIKTPLKNGAKIKFHTGTSEIVATVYLLKDKSVSAGEECLIQVRLNEPLVAGPRDRFILRMLSPVQTIGGGMIVEALAERQR